MLSDSFLVRATAALLLLPPVLALSQEGTENPNCHAMFNQENATREDKQRMRDRMMTDPREMQRIYAECMRNALRNIPAEDNNFQGQIFLQALDEAAATTEQTPDFIAWKTTHLASLKTDSDTQSELSRLRRNLKRYHEVVKTPDSLRTQEREEIASNFQTPEGDPREREEKLRNELKSRFDHQRQDRLASELTDLADGDYRTDFLYAHISLSGEAADRQLTRSATAALPKLRTALKATSATDVRQRASILNGLAVALALTNRNRSGTLDRGAAKEASSYISEALELAGASSTISTRDTTALRYNRIYTCESPQCLMDWFRSNPATHKQLRPDDPFAFDLMALAVGLQLNIGNYAIARNNIQDLLDAAGSQLPALERAMSQHMMAVLTLGMGDPDKAIAYLMAAETTASTFTDAPIERLASRRSTQTVSAGATARIMEKVMTPALKQQLTYKTDPAGFARDQEPPDAHAAVEYYVDLMWENYRSHVPTGSIVFGQASSGDVPVRYNRVIGAWLLGYAPGASQELDELSRYYDEGLNKNLFTLAFTEQLAFLTNDLPFHTSLVFSIGAAGAQLDNSYSEIIDWKGLLTYAARKQGQVIQDALTHSQFRNDASRLLQIRDELSSRMVSGAANNPATVDALTAEKEQLEGRLNRQFGSAIEPAQTLDIDKLKSILKDNEIFVDLYRYDRWDDTVFTATNYAAVIVNKTGSIRLLDLGASAAIDSLILAWRNAAVAGSTSSQDMADARVAWARLSDKLWNPIQTVQPMSAKRVIVSPDGELARIPWHLFHKDGVLVQVDSARALHLARTADVSKTTQSTLIVGNVDFGFGGLGLTPLRFTRDEVENISAYAADRGLTARVLSGRDASEERVSASLANATWVHLATHGLFYSQESSRASSRSIGESLVTVTGASLARNPMMSSGIALANANLVSPQQTDGFLTAEELLGLNLSQTKLVVLSACNTGRGRETTGQGVIGLRSAFAAAGVGSVLMSLWAVDDRASHELMRHFYDGLWNDGLSHAQALKLAQERVRSVPEFAHPYYWAAWVLTDSA